MSIDQHIALFSAMIALLTFVVGCAGLATVIIQLRDAARQREADSMVKLFDINRELLSLGFSHHGLFKVLEDQPTADGLSEKRYLQLWLNQLSLMHSYAQQAINQPELKESLDRNLIDFFTMKNMRHHWNEFGRFYPASFQRRVTEIIERPEPPQATALPTSGR